MIHTRTRSFSERSVEPTHGLGFWRSRSNSACSSADQAERSELSAFLSNMVRAMAFLLRRFTGYIASSGAARNGGGFGNFRTATGAGGGRLDERPARGIAAAQAWLGGRCLRAGRERARRAGRWYRGRARADRDAQAAWDRSHRPRRTRHPPHYP